MWLKKGWTRRSGVEMPGCFNTGFAPTVAHKNLVLLQCSFYMVGHEVDVADSVIAAYRCFVAGQRIVTDTTTGRKAYVYKSMAAARRKFEAMCKEALAARNAELAVIASLRQQRRDGDMGAALTLGIDYGM